ncbi:DUF5010 domain-containing protein [Bacteroides sp. 1001136B_160425_E2]|uniref:DUF5010 domain-containing protein n=1 Tax=Bacteroides sp. 1001136B_160425_E2 TaxID=2787083 RepID=UPI0018A0E5B1|nr:DUF5010 domain-containing protein [Bacteroides sp. 1001136B_160425_E2]
MMKFWQVFLFIGVTVLLDSCTDNEVAEGNIWLDNGKVDNGIEAEPLPPLSEARLKEDGYMGVLVGLEGGLRTGDMSSETTTLYNLPLFDVKALGATEEEWWDNLVEELAYSGVDYAVANCRGWLPSETKRKDHGNPERIMDMIDAMKRRGVEDKFKIAVFDDSPASWHAARNWNLYKKYSQKVLELSDFDGYNSDTRFPEYELQPKPQTEEQLVYPLDNLDPNDPLGCYFYIWTCNIKQAFANFYGENSENNKFLFKYKGRPVLYLWTLNGFLNKKYLGLGNKKIDCTGKLKAIILKMKEDFRREFGDELFVIPDRAWSDLDPQVRDDGVVDAMHVWFSGRLHPGRLYAGGNYYLLNNPRETDIWEWHYDNDNTPNEYIKVGTAIPGFWNNDLGGSGQFYDADHGKTLSTSLEMFTTQENGMPGDGDHRADLIFLEGFTDLLENAAYWRSTDTRFYDYPNQRLNILRQYSHYPFPYVQKLEAEACDFYFNNKVYPNEMKYITLTGKVKRCKDANYGGGWYVSGLRVNDHLQWKEIPFREGKTIVKVRYAYAVSEITLEVTVGDIKRKVVLPISRKDGEWATAEAGEFTFSEKGYRDVTIKVLNGAVDLNYIHLVAQ